MTRYFLDTNVLVALSFRHDRWSNEADRLLAGVNTLYTSEYNIFEYCSAGKGPRIPRAPREMRLDYGAERGVFGKVLDSFRKRVERNIPMYNRQIDLNRYEKLTLERVQELFFENIQVREQAKEYFVRYFREYFEDKELTPRNAKLCVEDLRDRLLHGARKRKDALLDEIVVKAARFHKQTSAKDRIQAQIGIGERGIPEDDLPWVLDVIALSEQNEVSRVVTGDKKHIVGNQEILSSLFGISILYLLDEFESDRMDRPA